MILIYILLGIIAIGVLLISEAGRMILSWIIRLTIIGATLFIGFWGVVIIWGLLSNKNMQNAILTVVGYILVAGVIIYLLIMSYKKYKQGKFSKQAIKSKALEIWEIDKSFIIFMAIFITAITLLFIFGRYLFNFNKTWSLGEIIGITLSLFIVAFISYLYSTPKFNSIVSSESNKIKIIIIKELYILAGLTFAWVVICLTSEPYYSSAPYQLANRFWLVSYPLSLFIRFILWAIRTLKDK